jgi:DNA-binding beta-propeller fold protein YncE
LTSNPDGLAIDPTTDTLYVSEGGPGPNQLEVIDAATCNVSQPACSDRATIPLTDGGGPLAIDASTHTVYVAGATSISVIDARHCHAGDLQGCATQAPAAIPVGSSFSLTTTPDTLYAATIPPNNLPGGVAVIDTRHCNAADTSQCASITPAVVTVGLDPLDVIADFAHRTLYVTDSAFGNSRGALSMVDISHCNGTDTSNCVAQTPLTTPMRRFPYQEALDPVTNTLYVGNFDNADLSPINTATCNARNKFGCPALPPEIVVGSEPTALALDAGNHTIYVSNNGDGTLSLVGTGP